VLAALLLAGLSGLAGCGPKPADESKAASPAAPAAAASPTGAAPDKELMPGGGPPK
jgi:hypothetical protein